MAKKKHLSTTKRNAYAVLVPTIILTLVWIFYASSMSKEDSAALSGKFSEIFGDIINRIASIFTDEPISIRKLAHFAEYALLGVQTSLLAHFVSRKSFQTACNVFLAGISTAVLDESIQILASRGPAVKDIIIDLFGYSTGGLCVFAVLLIIAVIKALKNH